MNAAAWRTTIAAAGLAALVMGTRSAFGLFLSPLNTATGIGLAAISLAVALGHLSLGLFQPAVGQLASRYGARNVVSSASVVLVVATVLLPQARSAASLALLLLLMAVAAGAVGSNTVLIAELGRRVPLGAQGIAIGIVGAGGSAGQLLLGPATQWAIDHAGWRAASWATAALLLLALPLAAALGRHEHGRAMRAPVSSSSVLRDALRNRRFLWVLGSFSLCGFHVSFISTNIPGVIELCGLPAATAGAWLAVSGAANILGSIAIGVAMRHWSSPSLLAALYTARALAIACLLAAPKTEAVMLLFAMVMGLTYLAPLAPTTDLLRREFGAGQLGLVMGTLMLAHQLGGFTGVWLGGWAAQASGSYSALWITDASLALCAAAMQWPLRQGRHAPAKPGPLILSLASNER